MTAALRGASPREDPKDAAVEAAEGTPAPRVAAAPVRGPALLRPRQRWPPRYGDKTHRDA